MATWWSNVRANDNALRGGRTAERLHQPIREFAALGKAIRPDPLVLSMGAHVLQIVEVGDGADQPNPSCRWSDVEDRVRGVRAAVSLARS